MPVSVCVAPLLPRRKRGKPLLIHANPCEGRQSVVYAVHSVESVELDRNSDIALDFWVWGRRRSWRGRWSGWHWGGIGSGPCQSCEDRAVFDGVSRPVHVTPWDATFVFLPVTGLGPRVPGMVDPVGVFLVNKAAFSGTTATTSIVVVMAVHDLPLEGQCLPRLRASSAQVFEGLCNFQV